MLPADALRRLDDPDRHVRRAAADALIAAGTDEVRDLMLARLQDETTKIEWPGVLTVLEGLGDRAFDALVDLLAGDNSAEVVRRAGSAFSDLRVSSPRRFVAVLRHPSARVRRSALFALRRLGEQAAPYAAEVVPSLTDPDEHVRQRAILAFRAMGQSAVPVLRAVRRSAAPQRRAALVALAELGAVEPYDLRLVERLIRIKSPGEVPEPMHLCGEWFALPTTDQAAVLEAFGLSAPFPVTMRMGADARTRDLHDYWRQPQHPHPDCARAYVTPVLDGWTLVFGTFLEPDHPPLGDAEEDDDAEGDDIERCAALSRRFGQAQTYGVNCGDDFNSWCLAEDGVVVRAYDSDDPDAAIGPRHPAEEGFLLPHEDGFPPGALDGVDPTDDLDAFMRRYREVKAELNIPDTCSATDVAERMSVDPGSLGAHTVVSGTAVLALTECGRRHGYPPAALEI
jgi:hypothetical protein